MCCAEYVGSGCNWGCNVLLIVHVCSHRSHSQVHCPVPAGAVSTLRTLHVSHVGGVWDLHSNSWAQWHGDSSRCGSGFHYCRMRHYSVLLLCKYVCNESQTCSELELTNVSTKGWWYIRPVLGSLLYKKNESWKSLNSLPKTTGIPL